jgi:cytidylate kinase
MGFIIAIDGPAGSGKSTVAKEVAKRLQLAYVDTGAIYRALALQADIAQLAEDDEERLSELATHLPLKIESGPDGQKYFLDGKDVSSLIRSERVSRLSSVVSKLKKVRERLLGLQRRLGAEAKQGAVLEGRDIGTVVFPKAEYKFFLTASNEERAQRRFDELTARGEKATFDKVLAEIIERDERDAKRDVAPMVPAPDAKIIDTTTLSLDAVIDSIVKVIHESH